MPSKEEQQKALNAKRALRKKQIAQLRASNEMLEATKEGIIKRYGEGSEAAEHLLEDIDVAKEQNLERAASYLGASKAEVESTQYNTVNPAEEKAYYDRLARQGKSDEELHIKDLTKLSEKKRASMAKFIQKPKSKLAEISEKLKRLNSKKEDLELIDEDDTMMEIPPEEIIAPNAGDITLRPYEQEQSFDDVPLEDLGKPVGKNEEEKEKIDYSKWANPFENKENVELPVENEVKESVKYNGNMNSVKTENAKYSKVREIYEDFDPRDVPSYVQYDMIPLPSNGECYPHKKKTIPVAYLTASDENLIISPNLYNSGQFIDIMLDRKILDKSIRAKDLCDGDRDAIVLWLRATAYGTDYPIVATKNGKEFNTTVDLSTLKYYDFNLKGDENGYFDYKTGNGDLIKFKILTHSDEMDLKNQQINKINNVNAAFISEECEKIIENINDITADGKEDVIDAIKQVSDWANIFLKEEVDVNLDKMYNESVTNRMYKYTMSVNGNSDREYIKNYIENMRANEAKKYREYVINNVPGVNLSVEVPVPESMGGGSFKSFLDYGEFIFVNV